MNTTTPITPADLVRHMLTAGTPVEWVAFLALLLVVLAWAVMVLQAVAYTVADVRRMRATKRP